MVSLWCGDKRDVLVILLNKGSRFGLQPTVIAPDRDSGKSGTTMGHQKWGNLLF